MQPVHRSEVRLVEPAIHTYDTGDLATATVFVGNPSTAPSSRRLKRDLKRVPARQTLQKIAAAGAPPAPKVQSFDRAELATTTVFTNGVSTNDSSRAWKSRLVGRSSRRTLRGLVGR